MSWSWKSFASGVASGVVASSAFLLLTEAGSYIIDVVRPPASSSFSANLYREYCLSGSIYGLIEQKKITGKINLIGNPESTNICADYDALGSVDAIVADIASRFDDCFHYTGGTDERTLRLDVASPYVCQTNATHPRSNSPILLCLKHKAAPDWAYNSNLDHARMCPSAIENHYSKTNPGSYRPN